MFGLKPKLLLTEEEREWLDTAFGDLENLLGGQRVVNAEVIVPTDKYFPDPYDDSPESARAMFERVAGYMGVDPAKIRLEIMPDEHAGLREVMPYWKQHENKAAGLYQRANEEIVIGLDEKQLKDPIAMVATLAHEFAHVILLGGGLIKPDHPHMEPLTDLCTVMCGFGVFNSTAAARFKQFQEDRKIGWSMSRIGYMSEPMYGYALAKFARFRDEPKPSWGKYLSTNVSEYFKKSVRWIEKSS
jgi:hypothetical protein